MGMVVKCQEIADQFIAVNGTIMDLWNVQQTVMSIVMMMNFDALEGVIQMVVINLTFVLQSNVIIFPFYLFYCLSYLTQ